MGICTGEWVIWGGYVAGDLGVGLLCTCLMLRRLYLTKDGMLVKEYEDVGVSGSGGQMSSSSGCGFSFLGLGTKCAVMWFWGGTALLLLFLRFGTSEASVVLWFHGWFWLLFRIFVCIVLPIFAWLLWRVWCQLVVQFS